VENACKSDNLDVMNIIQEQLNVEKEIININKLHPSRYCMEGDNKQSG